MPLTRRANEPAETLPPTMAALLIHGPWRVNLTLATMPPDAELERLWQIHGPALKGTLPKGQRCWFEDRRWFTAVVSRQPEPE